MTIETTLGGSIEMTLGTGCRARCRGRAAARADRQVDPMGDALGGARGPARGEQPRRRPPTSQDPSAGGGGSVDDRAGSITQGDRLTAPSSLDARVVDRCGTTEEVTMNTTGQDE